MGIVSDYHLHTSFSEDSDTPMEDMIRAAIALGLKEICFTEHLDLDYPKDCGSFLLDLDAYTDCLLSLRKTYGKVICIRLGLEMGMQAHLGETYARIAGQYPFDFLIASQHLVEGASGKAAGKNRFTDHTLNPFWRIFLLCPSSTPWGIWITLCATVPIRTVFIPMKLTGM